MNARSRRALAHYRGCVHLGLVEARAAAAREVFAATLEEHLPAPHDRERRQIDNAIDIYAAHLSDAQELADSLASDAPDNVIELRRTR